VATSAIERAQSADKIGCVRRFKLKDGSELREQLLALSDLEQTFSYCLLDTPIPMFNYVAHVRLLPVTDGDRTFWQWESRFTTRPADQEGITRMVAEFRRGGGGIVRRSRRTLPRRRHAGHARAERGRHLDLHRRARERFRADEDRRGRAACHDRRRHNVYADLGRA
jgi:hypothetical protein